MTTVIRLNPAVMALACVLLSGGLTGCGKNDTASGTADALALPLTTAPETLPPAPAADALPEAPPPRIVQVSSPSDDYAYVDRAYAMSSAIGEAPPDYGFDYQGVHPWVWRSSDRSVQLVEPVPGGYRYYYYQPGASEPYLVRDPQYSYGFSDGQLAAVYDGDGQMLAPQDIDRRTNDAGRYLARAAALYQAAIQSERHSVNAANWAERRRELDAARSQWEADQSRQAAWRAYHNQHDAEEQAYWQAESQRRDQAARSFNDWSQRGYMGAAPPPVHYAQSDIRGSQPVIGQPGRQTQQQQQPSGDQARQQAQADAAREAQARADTDKAAADASVRAQQQRGQADAARVQQQAQADAARQSQAKAAADKAAADKAAADKAAADASVRAQQQRGQADAARAQQQAQADAARQAQAKADAARVQQQAQADAARQSQAKAAADRTAADKAAADASAHAQQQRAQADAARAQQQAQADAARQSQAKAAADKAAADKAAADKAAADASTRAQQQRAQADAAHAQQQAQADAARGSRRTQQTPAAPQPVAATAPEDKKAGDARRGKKPGDDTHPGDDASGKSPAQQ